MSIKNYNTKIQFLSNQQSNTILNIFQQHKQLKTSRITLDNFTHETPKPKGLTTHEYHQYGLITKSNWSSQWSVICRLINSSRFIIDQCNCILDLPSPWNLMRRILHIQGPGIHAWAHRWLSSMLLKAVCYCNCWGRMFFTFCIFVLHIREFLLKKFK